MSARKEKEWVATGHVVSQSRATSGRISKDWERLAAQRWLQLGESALLCPQGTRGFCFKEANVCQMVAGDSLNSTC